MFKFRAVIIFLLIKSLVCEVDNPTNNESLESKQPVINSTTTQTPITHSVPMNFAKNDLLYLSELPLEQLLKVKKSLEEIQQVNRQGDIGVVEENTASAAAAAVESRIINEPNLGHEKAPSNIPLPLVSNSNNQQQLTINR